jgi:hypothetical protein
MKTKPGEVCEHGSLKRYCIVCELQEEIGEQKKQIFILRSERNEARTLAEYFAWELDKELSDEDKDTYSGSLPWRNNP